MFKGVLAAAVLTMALAAGGASNAAGPHDPLVSTDWLAQHLNDRDLVLLHVGDRGAFGNGHIPGAHFIELDDISTPHQPGALMLQVPSAEVLKQRLQALGISDASHVVVYFADDWVSPATRVMFTLDAAGLGDHVELLDGGMNKWRREGHALTKDAVPAARGTLSNIALRPSTVDAEFVRSHVGQPHYVLIDARAPVFYDGLRHSGAMGHERNGHIPGAHNLPFDSVTNDDLTFKSPAQLTALFRQAGVAPGDHVIAYCHIGQQATAVLFAARLAGVDAVLYDGSFEDWTMRNYPVER
ncbi:MAG: rhodanese-like domain-containing protein [Pseudomonadota bacterium]